MVGSVVRGSKTTAVCLLACLPIPDLLPPRHCCCWQSTRAFSADDCGRIGCIQIEGAKPSSGASSDKASIFKSADKILSETASKLLKSGPDMIFDAEARVVQMRCEEGARGQA